MKVTVCIGSSCHLKGSRQVVEKLQALIAENNLDGQVELAGTFCLGECQRMMCGPVWCEKNADKGYLAREIANRGQPASLYTEHENKYVKISTFLRKWWSAIRWLEGTDAEYLNQILSYTEDAEHDDAPDSAASVCRILDRRGGGDDYVSPFSR